MIVWLQDEQAWKRWCYRFVPRTWLRHAASSCRADAASALVGAPGPTASRAATDTGSAAVAACLVETAAAAAAAAYAANAEGASATGWPTPRRPAKHGRRHFRAQVLGGKVNQAHRDDLVGEAEALAGALGQQHVRVVKLRTQRVGRRPIKCSS